MRVRILGAKHGADRKHAIEVAGDGHLLVELRRLSEICFA